jgi:hypothetical protein
VEESEFICQFSPGCDFYLSKDAELKIVSCISMGYYQDFWEGGGSQKISLQIYV